MDSSLVRGKNVIYFYSPGNEWPPCEKVRNEWELRECAIHIQDAITGAKEKGCRLEFHARAGLIAN